MNTLEIKETLKTKWAVVFGKITMVSLQININNEYVVNGIIYNTLFEAEYQFNSYTEPK